MARRYLRSPRQEGFLSVMAGFSFLGIALGVATLIIVMSVMNGFRQELLTRIVGLKGHVTVSNAQGPTPYDPKMHDLLKSVPGALGVSPVLENQGIVLSKKQAQGVVIRGMTSLDIQARPMIAKSLSAQGLKSFEGEKILIGKRLAESLFLREGDSLALMIPEGQMTPFGSVPKQRRFIVGGIFHIGMHEYDKHLVFLPLASAQNFFQKENQISFYEISASHPELSGALAHTIFQALGPQYRVLDWRHSDSHIFQAVQIERNVMFLILTLIVLIAAFNIISGMILLVKDKTSDIAILRTMGASKTSIMKIFLFTGSSIGLVGTALGVALGLSFSLNIERIRQFMQKLLQVDLFREEIYFLSKLPARVDSHDVFLITGMAVGISFLATLYPSWRASRLHPAESLKQSS